MGCQDFRIALFSLGHRFDVHNCLPVQSDSCAMGSNGRAPILHVHLETAARLRNLESNPGRTDSLSSAGNASDAAAARVSKSQCRGHVPAGWFVSLPTWLE